MAALIVRGNGHVDKFGGRVGVAERDDGDVHVGGFFDGLRVRAGVRHDDQAGFFEGARYVVREIPWGEAAGDCDGASVGSEFEDGALAEGPGRDYGDVRGVVYCCDDAGCEDDFLPVRVAY